MGCKYTLLVWRVFAVNANAVAESQSVDYFF